MDRFIFLVKNNKILYFIWFVSTVFFAFLGLFMDYPDSGLLDKNILNGSIYLVSLALVGAFFTNLIDIMRSDFELLRAGKTKEFFLNIKFFLLFLLFIFTIILMKIYSVETWRIIDYQVISFIPILLIGIWIFSLTLFDENDYLRYREKREMLKVKKKSRNNKSFRKNNKKVKL